MHADMHTYIYKMNVYFQDRSIAISTYALCGFANISSIGIMLGVIGALAPERKGVLATFVVRAMITGAVASFMTASVAGALYKILENVFLV